MDESLLELENELKRLRPSKPSAKLLADIEAGLAGSSRPTSRMTTSPTRGSLGFPGLAWRKIAAAAAVLILAAAAYTIRRPVPINRAESKAIAENAPAAVPAFSPADESLVTVPAKDQDRYRPVGAASVLYDLREEGTAERAINPPVRRLRYRYVDTYTWKNPATNASLKWSLPRDEVRVLPASLH